MRNVLELLVLASFEEATLRGTLGKNAIESTKSLYDLVVVDSEGIEKSFAESLEAEDDVVVYSKLPGGFYINTPMGKYNPDWAVAFRRFREARLFRGRNQRQRHRSITTSPCRGCQDRVRPSPLCSYQHWRCGV